MSNKERDFFVPGRLCLFGEHSDWVGGHRRQNSEISVGQTIVVPTNQGTYALAREINEPYLEFDSYPFQQCARIPLDEEKLLKIAKEGGVFSYVAGVAYEIITNYQNEKERGISIKNYKTDLPIKKGLSSSASVCVLTAKVFNEIFNLKWTPKRIMEIAYLGEITTSSRCGRMDQVCAYNKPVLMSFDGDRLEIEELKIGGDFYLLIVDLKSKKDTKRILGDLNKGFPFPTNDEEKRKHEYFNKINTKIIEKAKEILNGFNPRLLGETMSSAQQYFDEYLAPSCPELTAPRLHQVLNYPEIHNYIWGGKGVGSGGDGSAQLVCKSEEDRKKTRKMLEEKLGLECFDLDLKKN